MPLWFAYRIGWEEYVNEIERAVKQLYAAEFRDAIIFVPTYGQAGAIELLGRGRNLPPTYATQNNYFHWGPPPQSTKTAVVSGPIEEERLQALFHRVDLFTVHRCQGCMEWRENLPIWIAREPIVLLNEAWPELKFYQ